MVRDPKEKRGVTLVQAKSEDQRLFHGSQRGENPILPFFDHREMIMNNLVAIPMQVQVAFDATSRRCASQFTSPNCGHRSNPPATGVALRSLQARRT